MQIQILTDPAAADWEQVSFVLAQAGMSQLDPSIWQSVFMASQARAFAFIDGRLVGTARALSDMIRQGAVYDVAVLPAYQAHGVGRALMGSIMAQLPGVSLILFASPGKEGFYETLGFRRLKTGMARFVRDKEMARRGFTK